VRHDTDPRRQQDERERSQNPPDADLSRSDEDSRSTEVPTRRAPTHDETPDARPEGRPQPGPRGPQAPMPPREADEPSRQPQATTDQPMGAGQPARPMGRQGRAAGPGQPGRLMGPGLPGGAGMTQPHAGLVPPTEADMTVPPGEAFVARQATRPDASDQAADFGPRSTDRIAPEVDQPDRGARQPGGPAKMFQPDEASRLRGEWQRVQATFVDNPQEAVQGADALVTDVIRTLQNSMGERHKALRRSTQDTEELRQTLHQYRALLDQLLDA
jgi:hypothetical protein